MAKKRLPGNPVSNPVPQTMPGRRGGTLKRGGTNPGAGRPPNEFRRALLSLVDRKDVLAHIQTALDAGPDDKGDFWQAVKYCTDQGAGKAPETKKIEGDEEKPIKHVFEVVYRNKPGA